GSVAVETLHGSRARARSRAPRASAEGADNGPRLSDRIVVTWRALARTPDEFLERARGTVRAPGGSRMRSPWRCLPAFSIVFAAASACGRSGLDIPPVDLDAGVYSLDAPVDTRPPEVDARVTPDAPDQVDAPAIDAPIQADGPVLCCGEEQNTNFPPDDTC